MSACSPVSESEPEPAVFEQRGPAQPGRIPGGFYPTWEVGTTWAIGVYDVEQNTLDAMSSRPEGIPATVGRFSYFEVEDVGPSGTVTLKSYEARHEDDDPSVVDRYEIDRSGAITKVESPYFGSHEPVARDRPYGHPRRTSYSGHPAIRVWPVFPLEPGAREGPDGGWMQTVRADGDARIVTIVFNESPEGAPTQPSCPATVIQRWEPGRPFWSYRIANGCTMTWGHGALVTHGDDQLVPEADLRSIVYPGANEGTPSR